MAFARRIPGLNSLTNIFSLSSTRRIWGRGMLNISPCPIKIQIGAENPKKEDMTEYLLRPSAKPEVQNTSTPLFKKSPFKELAVPTTPPPTEKPEETEVNLLSSMMKNHH